MLSDLIGKDDDGDGDAGADAKSGEAKLRGSDQGAVSDSGSEVGGSSDEEETDEADDAPDTPVASGDADFAGDEAILEQNSSRIAEFVVNQFKSRAGRKKQFNRRYRGYAIH